MPPTTTTDDGGEPFALKYGALESVLTGLLGDRGDAIVTRFRKLRPKFAADGLLTATGNRVRYDLTRVLAICAIYEINALSIPQGHAVDLVVANWPELAKACLSAWRQKQADGAPNVPGGSSCVRIYVDALNDSPDTGSWASLERVSPPVYPHIALDCQAIVDAVNTSAENAGQADRLAIAFDELDGTFGWDALDEGDPERLPTRKESDFFGTGPYFARARSLLAADPETRPTARRATYLQALLDYLEEPAPIDSWKRFIGTERDRPRLVHMLAAWGVSLGLTSRTIGISDVLQSASSNRGEALELIGRGEARAAELAGRA